MRSILFGFFLLSSLFGLSGLLGCAVKQQPLDQSSFSPSAVGQIYQHDGTPVLWEKFIDGLSQADYILLGETHNNVAHHHMQARILEALAKKGARPLLGLEMLTKKEQPALDAYTQGAIPLELLPKTVDWEATWGFDFTLYAPIFQVAKEFSVPIYGLNIPQETLQAVRVKGLHGVLAEERRFMPTRIVAPHSEQYKRLQAFFKQHAFMLAQAQKTLSEEKKYTEENTGKQRLLKESEQPQVQKNEMKVKEQDNLPEQEGSRMFSERFLRFLLVQSLWDNTMAENAVKARFNTRQPMVILAGSEHVRYGFGIMHRVKTYEPTAQCIVVLPIPHVPNISGTVKMVQQKEEASTVLPFPAHFYVYTP